MTEPNGSTIDPNGGAWGIWLKRMNEAGNAINRVAIPSFLVVVFSIYCGAVLFGYAPSPFVSRIAFDIHRTETSEFHQAQLNESRELVKTMRSFRFALERSNCEAKSTAEARLLCFANIHE